ncbi:hypothetical protein SAV31267_062850 [Streptomyces avermitilis]|uniref:Uncharacterized protein n=1 Tax=Streptomyces avermitilis TaxID=33903 RepID=A0A4D4MXA7_STRAX|nr:hypothetical protein SAV31267_062850 [Streptomyces avermitilis]
MSYDTAMPLESLYGGYVAQQTSLALEVTPESTDLLMGLPFYYEDNLSHHGSAETVAAAVRGTRLGLSRTDRDRENFGSPCTWTSRPGSRTGRPTGRAGCRSTARTHGPGTVRRTDGRRYDGRRYDGGAMTGGATTDEAAFRSSIPATPAGRTCGRPPFLSRESGRCP